MKRFAVLGDPVAHSRSPAMHAAAYRALRLDCSYEAIRATPEDLARLVRALRDGEYDGLDVTLPHKTRILDHVDRLDASVSAIGAANTLVRAPGGQITAFNTDVPALASELRRLALERTAEEWRASTAIVLGSGGAARSAVAALQELEVGEILLRARSPLAAEPARFSNVSWEKLGAPGPGPKAEDRALTVVQATSSGMTGADPGDVVASAVAWGALPARAVALDVVYVPPETPFLRAATSHGIRAANGLGMLATQGALAFELWLGLPAPINAMLSALV